MGTTGFVIGPYNLDELEHLTDRDADAAVAMVALCARAAGVGECLPAGVRRRSGSTEPEPGSPGRKIKAAQFSSDSPSTRSNSRTFVTSVAFSTSAWQAIHRSLPPIGVPAASRAVAWTAWCSEITGELG